MLRPFSPTALRAQVDESYTPSCISIRIGTSLHDLQEIHVVDLKEPDGWVPLPAWRSGEIGRVRGVCCPKRQGALSTTSPTRTL